MKPINIDTTVFTGSKIQLFNKKVTLKSHLFLKRYFLKQIIEFASDFFGGIRFHFFGDMRIDL